MVTTRSVHGGVKTLVYRAIMSNPVFNVPQLCDWTGLGRNQLYPHLAELKEKGFLKTESLIDKSPSPAHRPLTLYRLTQDPKLLGELAVQIAPFLQMLSNQVSLGSENLERAQTKLEDLEKELARHEEAIAAATTEGSLKSVAQPVQLLKAEMDRVKDDVELAWYESGSEESPLRSTLQREVRRVQQDFDRLRHLSQILELRLREIESAKTYSEIVRWTLGHLTWEQPQSALDSFKRHFAKAYQGSPSPVQEMLSVTAAQGMSTLELADRHKYTDWRAKFYRVLAEYSLRFGSDLELSFDLIAHLRQETASVDVLTEQNFVSICFLLGRTDKAFEQWAQRLRTVRAQTERVLSAYPFTLVLKHAYGEITGEVLEELQLKLGLDGAVSILSQEALKDSTIAPYVLEPTLADWLEPGNSLPLSDPIRAQQAKLYAYGPLQDLLRSSGLPALRAATSLFGVGANPAEAWEYARSILPTSALLLLHLRESRFDEVKHVAKAHAWSEIGRFDLKVPESRASTVAGTFAYMTSDSGAAGVQHLPPLPYDYAALEPFIDKYTMILHHDMHHGAYVKNLNAALEKHPELSGKSVEELLRDLNAVPEDVRSAVRNNGGGHVNHSMYWKIMKPQGGGDPSGPIADIIQKTFGNFKDFQAKFNDAGLKQFGSGWVWLVGKSSGAVQVISTPNQDSPISQGLFPIFGNDLWEHAYYLKYNNRRPEYLSAWWNLVNWEEINQRVLAFTSAPAKQATAMEAAFG